MRPYRTYNTHVLGVNESENGTFIIKGDLTFTTINENTIKTIPFKRLGQTLAIDLQGVTGADSAGLALMVEWLKISKKNSCTLNFINIPPQLQALAKICGINGNLTLPTDEESTQDKIPHG